MGQFIKLLAGKTSFYISGITKTMWKTSKWGKSCFKLFLCRPFTSGGVLKLWLHIKCKVRQGLNFYNFFCWGFYFNMLNNMQLVNRYGIDNETKKFFLLQICQKIQEEAFQLIIEIIKHMHLMAQIQNAIFLQQYVSGWPRFDLAHA